MYVGHAAIALALKAREPRLPIVALTLACYGPDWLELLLMVPKPREGMAIYTHSLPAVLLGAVVASALYALSRRPGARLVFLAWLLHWPCDLFTGKKPVLDREPLVGLDLYGLPFVDFLLESTVVAIGCALYARRYAPDGGGRRLVLAMGAALIVLQGAVDVALAVMRRDAVWSPSLASARSQPHLSSPAEQSTCDPHGICVSSAALTLRGSDGDPGTAGRSDADLPHVRQGKVLHQ